MPIRSTAAAIAWGNQEDEEDNMKRIDKAMPHTQVGGFYSTVIIVAMFGLFLTAGLKIAPLYMDNNVVVDAMEGVKANNDISTMSLGEIRNALNRTLLVNRVELPSDAMKEVREGGRDYILISYEARTPLFYNISAVVEFNNRFEKN